MLWHSPCKARIINTSTRMVLQEILMQCWAAKPEERVGFTEIQKTVEKLPKKRLARSPSHPIHLSRSAESVF